MQSQPPSQDAPVLFVDASLPAPAPELQNRQSFGSRAQPLPNQAPAGHMAGAESAPAALPDTATAGLQTGQEPFSHALPVPGMGLRDWIRQKKKAAAAAVAFPQVQVFCPDARGDLVGSSSQSTSSPSSRVLVSPQHQAGPLLPTSQSAATATARCVYTKMLCVCKDSSSSLLLPAV